MTRQTSEGWRCHRIAAAVDGFPTSDPGLDCYELDSGRAGPLVVVLGGVHGDEPEGVVSAGRLTSEDVALRRGRLRVVPICNEEAFLAGSRTTPSDGANLAREFPGDGAGTLTQRIAHVLAALVLSDADLLIDLHTAGRRYDMPLTVGCLGQDSPAGRGSQLAAMAFGPDLMWVHPTYSPGRTIHYMLARNRPAIYAEAPGGEHLDLGTVERYVEGVRRVLGELDMVDVGHVSAEERNTPTVVAGGGNLDKDVIRFSAGGLFIAAVGAGELVAESQSLGVVQDVRGRVLQDVHALQKGHVMFLRRTALVRPGDVAACIAGDDRPPLATLSR